MANSTFNAVISGRSGIGMLTNQTGLFSFATVDDQLARREAAELSYLLGAAQDLEFVEDCTLESARDLLGLARRREQALDLVLILLDGSYPPDLRREAGDDLASLLADADVIRELECVMFSAPLPAGIGVAEAVALLPADHGAAEWLSRLGQFQAIIRVFWQTSRLQLSDAIESDDQRGRAEVLKAMGGLPEALAAYEAVIRERSENVFAKTGQAEVLKAMGRLPEAMAAYDAVKRG